MLWELLVIADCGDITSELDGNVVMVVDSFGVDMTTYRMNVYT